MQPSNKSNKPINTNNPSITKLKRMVSKPKINPNQNDDQNEVFEPHHLRDRIAHLTGLVEKFFEEAQCFEVENSQLKRNLEEYHKIKQRLEWQLKLKQAVEQKLTEANKKLEEDLQKWPNKLSLLDQKIKTLENQKQKLAKSKDEQVCKLKHQIEKLKQHHSFQIEKQKQEHSLQIEKQKQLQLEQNLRLKTELQEQKSKVDKLQPSANQAECLSSLLFSRNQQIDTLKSKLSELQISINNVNKEKEDMKETLSKQIILTSQLQKKKAMWALKYELIEGKGKLQQEKPKKLDSIKKEMKGL